MKKNKIRIFSFIVTVILIGIILNSWNQNKNESLKIPTTTSKIKNVIVMIGDGMGENHIIAGEIYKGEKLNIQNIENKSYVTTYSASSDVTDSAAAATALATGYKTYNGAIGKDIRGNDLQNLTEYAKSKGLKTGIVCTQVLTHATPAGFSVHNVYRYNYEGIAKSQINSSIDLMLGGGREYFSKHQNLMIDNNCFWINELSEIENADRNKRIIGTFADNSISETEKKTRLSDMAQAALLRLDNANGFFVMIEGSDIDSYSHKNNMAQMLIELIDFDNAVKVAMNYVDNNPDTLLIVTADHETGGLVIDGVNSREQLNDSLFTSGGEHTGKDVLVYAYGAGAEDLTSYNKIDNTAIPKFIKQGLENMY